MFKSALSSASSSAMFPGAVRWRVFTSWSEITGGFFGAYHNGAERAYLASPFSSGNVCTSFMWKQQEAALCKTPFPYIYMVNDVQVPFR